MDLLNRTPFATDRFVFVHDGLEALLVVVKGTFTVERGATRHAELQEPVVPADEYLDGGDPAKASVARAGEAVLFKPAADVLLRGHAYAPPRASEVNVGLAVGPLRKMARVVGERVYVGRLVGASRPVPFEKLPLVWERAFGGADASRPERVERCEENPVGRGFRASGSKLPVTDVMLPNIEDPAQPIESPRTRARAVGFGPIAPSWLPRRKYAGTYDDAWRKDRCPSLPKDFDPRFNLCAPPDQVLQGYIAGGEVVALTGASPTGPLKFEVPRVQPVVTVRLRRGRELPPVVCDTLVVDGDGPSLVLVWRASLVVQGRIQDVRSIEVTTA